MICIANINKFRILHLVIALCLLISFHEISLYASEVRGVTDNFIKIGLLGDQTGAAASVGIPITEATRIYFRNIPL